MSRRLFQQATSGIVSLPTPDGERVIPASRRPDGSIRPARKVRSGYVPAEDQQRFQSRRPLPSVSQPSRPGGSWHKQETASSSQHRSNNNNKHVVKSAWDDDSDTEVQQASTKGQGFEDMTSAQRKNEKRKMKRQKDAQEKMAAELQASVEAAVKERQQAPKDKKETLSKADDDDNTNDNNTSVNSERRVRALNKKIRQAKELQRRRDEDGAVLLPQETDKVESIDELQAELEKLSLNIPNPSNAN
ncbi:hypothetical protein BDF19DRAFT_444515 [Syncephalis fuscata]|nr:hypothetical protein BDF19DRAFT_444515 [Syncephalis fuscata]